MDWDVTKTDVVILCGGQGKRLRKVVQDRPKIMADIGGRPFLVMLIDWLRSYGIKRVILCVGYKANIIREYCEVNNLGVTIEFSYEDKPLGTGGALRNAEHLIYSNPFFCMNGDSILSFSLKDLLSFHLENSADASIVVSYNYDKADFGSISLDEDNRITGFLEKSDQFRYLNAGFYCFNRDIFSFMPSLYKFSLEYDFFPNLLLSKRIYGFKTNKGFYDIGTPERYFNAIKHLKEFL